MYNVAKPDGLTLGALLPAIYFDQLVGRKEVQFDFAKIPWIGSPEQNDIIHYMRADSPYKSIDDIRKAKEPPRCGSSGTGTTGFYIPRLLDEVLGTKHTVVAGYPGGSEIDLAVERGEVHCWSPLVATYFGREPYISWQKKDYVRVVVQFGAKREPRLADVPTIYELMDQYKTPEAGKRLTRVILVAATLGRPIAVTAGHSTRPLEAPARRLSKDLERPRAHRRDQTPTLGHRPAHRRGDGKTCKRSHGAAEGCDRENEVGAGKLTMKKSRSKVQRFKAFNRIFIGLLDLLTS